jgi:hypothetical protein
MAPDLAPCVAVVGPANSGKTTLLHFLDDALQRHPAAPLVYVVKANPDGSGRYLFHAPDLREPLKERVKGAWSESTVETVSQWVGCCRRRLDLVLLDVGGKHSSANAALYRAATHCIVVARRFRDPAREAAEGMESWRRACVRSGLRPLARVRSLWRRGEPKIRAARDGGLAASFRADASAPDDLVNQLVLRPLVESLLQLALHRPRPSYFNLSLDRDWTFADLADLAGRANLLDALVGRGGRVVLGGRAPLWAYAAALHRALDLRPDVTVEVFDPKVPPGLVEIPQRLGQAGAPSLVRSVQATWHPASAGSVLLDLRIATPDHFLVPALVQGLASAPLPAGEPPPGTVVVSGAVPIWLHLAYSRWLRSLPERRTLGIWDARTRSAVLITGPAAPASIPWALPPSVRFDSPNLREDNG